jgi:hypothetical protein
MKVARVEAKRFLAVVIPQAIRPQNGVMLQTDTAEAECC